MGEALPYFVDWLIENVHLVEITAYSDDDAYTIFETMNDRGLSLSPTDMLKGTCLRMSLKARSEILSMHFGKSLLLSYRSVVRTSIPTSLKRGCAANMQIVFVNARKGQSRRTLTGSAQSFIAGCENVASNQDYLLVLILCISLIGSATFMFAIICS